MRRHTLASTLASALTSALACSLALLGLVCAPAAAAGPKEKDPFDLPVERYELPSGMRVLLHKDGALPQVVVSLWFDVGSRNERPGRTGFAHLYEHLMFMGSKNVPAGGFDEIMEEAGGSNNASTSPDTTFYHDSGPASLLPVLLWLEAERLTTLPQAMTQEKVDLQREVVRNERRQSYENRPYGAAELRIPEAMYPKGHPYSWPVIGSHADLLAANVDDVKQFFYDYYVPSNATLAIAGDFNPEEARRLVQHYFGWMPKRPRPQAPTAAPPSKPVQAQITLSDRVDLGRLYLAWHAPPAGAPEAVDVEVLADALGRGQGSRLHRALVYDKRLAQEVKVELERQSLGSLLIAEITAQPGVRVDDLQRAVEAELARLVREPLRPEELERAKNQRLTEWAKELEPLVERSQMLQMMNALHGDPDALKGEVARVQALQPEALRARAAALGLGEAARRLTVRVVPAPAAKGDAKGEAKKDAARAVAESKAEAKAPPATAGASAAGKAPGADKVAEERSPPSKADAPARTGDKAADKGKAAALGPLDMRPPYDLSKRPSPLSPRPFSPPKAARFRVGQLDVVLVRRPGALLQALLVVPAGAAAAPAQPGLAQAALSLVTEGAGERDAAAVAEALERLGAHVERKVTPDSSLLSLELTGAQWPAAAPIFYDIVARPRLSDGEWRRVRGERIAEVLREQAEAAYLADLYAAQAIFGTTHPYGQPPLGTEAGLRGLSLQDVRAFHAQHWRPGLASLVLAGDVELSQREAERLAGPFAAWRAGKGAPPAAQEVQAGAGKDAAGKELTALAESKVPGAAGKDPPAGKDPAAFPPPRPETPRLVLYDRPGAPQSELRVVNLAPAQGSQDRAQAEVANMLLGGTFTSRLNQNLRERRGWAYGAYSRLLPLEHAGVFVVHAAVRSDVSADAATESLAELRRLLAEPVSARELDKGRRSFTQQLLERCERVEELALLMGDVVRYRLPLDTLDRLARGASRTDGKAMLRAAKAAMRPAAASVVLVGDRQKIEGPLRAKLPNLEVEIR